MNKKREHYREQFATNTDPRKILLLEREVQSILLAALQDPTVCKYRKTKLKEIERMKFGLYDWATSVAFIVAVAVNKARLITKRRE